MLQCLSQRNHSDYVCFELGKHDNNNPPSKSADSNPTVLAVILSIIKTGEHRSLEDLPSVGEIEAMLTDVRFVLFIVPLKAHE